jgi:hypothetical protein
LPVIGAPFLAATKQSSIRLDPALLAVKRINEEQAPQEEKLMSRTRTALNCAVMLIFAIPLAASAAAPVVPPGPPAPKHKPYQPGEQNSVTGAYEFRTRILTGTPGCQRFAAESDAAFLDVTTDDNTKVALLGKIGAEAAASNCLAP